MPLLITRRRTVLTVKAALEAHEVLARDMIGFCKWIKNSSNPEEAVIRVGYLDHQLLGAVQVLRDGDLDDERRFVVQFFNTWCTINISKK